MALGASPPAPSLLPPVHLHDLSLQPAQSQFRRPHQPPACYHRRRLIAHQVATLQIVDGMVEEAWCPECGYSILPLVLMDRYDIQDVIYEHLKEQHSNLAFIESRGVSPFEFSGDDGEVEVNVFLL
jgi:hypothetical protein